MPIYEYRCEECGRTYEQIRRMSEADKDLKCPSCESTKVARQVSTFAAGACGSGSGGRGQFR